MKTPSTKPKKGFTIIEVSLVLAIGGLIMLMVFIAWPAVRRNQRDSQRKSADLTRLFTALTNYTTNNSGRLPSVPEDKNAIVVTYDDTTEAGTGGGKWETFYNNYLLANNDTFVDPIGTPYNLSIVTCSNDATANTPNKSLSIGAPCDNATALKDGALINNFDEQAATVTIVIGANCNGENAEAATAGTGGTRKFAIMYALESGGVYCESN